MVGVKMVQKQRMSSEWFRIFETLKDFIQLTDTDSSEY